MLTETAQMRKADAQSFCTSHTPNNHFSTPHIPYLHELLGYFEHIPYLTFCLNKLFYYPLICLKLIAEWQTV